MGERRDEDMRLPIHTDQRSSRGNETRQMKRAMIGLFCIMANVIKDCPEGVK
jgi:hypothetical protein